MLSRVSHCRHHGLFESYSSWASSRASTAAVSPTLGRQPGRLRRSTAHNRHVHTQQKPVTQDSRVNSRSWANVITPPLKAASTLTEDQAIDEALAGRAEHLHRRLASALEEKDYRGAMELFERYATASEASLPEASEGKAVGVKAVEGAETVDADPDTHLPRAVLYAITAYAAEDSFRPLLDVYVKIGAPELPHDIRLEHLSATPHGPLHDKVLSYSRDLAAAHFIANTTNLSKYISSLSKSSMSKGLARLYEGVLDKITGPDPFIAASDSVSSDLPLAMKDASWALFIQGFAQCQRPDLAERVFDDMKALNVRPGLATWVARLCSLGQRNLVDATLECWDQILEQGIEPDPVAYSTLISLYFREKQPRLALQSFAKFQETEKQFDTQQRMMVYNSVIEGLLRSRLLPQADQFLRMMETKGPTPDIVTVNTFLNYYGRQQDFQGILKMMNKMEEHGVKADVYTFSTVLSALLRAGRKDAIDVVLQCMKEQGVQANVAIYSALIDDQLRKGDDANWRAALALLTSMEGNEKLSPNNVTYTTFLVHLHRRNNLTPAEQGRYRRNILQRMRDRHVWFSLPDYHILIKACFDNWDAAKSRIMLQYYREIKARGIPCVNSTYYILLAGLIQNGEWEMARDIVRDIDLGSVSNSVSNLMRKVQERTS